jgi:hypothetical protein
MTLNELTSYYSQKLAYQYRGLARADAQMQLYVKQAVADYLANQLSTCFALDAAVGVQLDTLGKYIGISRNIGLPVEMSAFGFWTYSSTFDPTKYQGVWNPTSSRSPTHPAAGHLGRMVHHQLPRHLDGSYRGDVQGWRRASSNGSVWAKSEIYNGNGLTTYNDSTTNINSIFYQYASSEL